MHREEGTHRCAPKVREALVERAAAASEGLVERMRHPSAARPELSGVQLRDGGVAVEDIAGEGLAAGDASMRSCR